MTTRQQDFQAPVQYDPPDVVLARLGFNDDASRAFVYAEAAVMKVDQSLLDIPENVAEVVKAAQYTRYPPGYPDGNARQPTSTGQLLNLEGRRFAQRQIVAGG